MGYGKIIGRAAALLSVAALIGASPEVMVFAGQRRAAGESRQEAGENLEVPYGERSYEGIDLARLEQLLGQLERACQGQGAMDAAQRQEAMEMAQGQESLGDPVLIYRQVLREVDWAATQMALADILYSRNMEDEALASQYEEASERPRKPWRWFWWVFRERCKCRGELLWRQRWDRSLPVR